MFVGLGGEISIGDKSLGISTSCISIDSSCVSDRAASSISISSTAGSVSIAFISGGVG